MTLHAGQRLGHYEVVSPLGAGGMGEVYRARDDSLDREVAIKVLPDAVAHDSEKLQRFEREAKSLAALNHPNVATLYGLERDGDTPFLAMELVEGPTLVERIRQGALPWREAAEVFLQIAQGLEAAHERGIVHRDLKPANVKLGQADSTGDGRVKILDFGLATAMAPDDTATDPAELGQSPTLTLGATRRGEILGTAGYMAPEQARGGSVDKRADVWAFGVCLFEALTARHGFRGDTVSDRLASVLKDEPDWEALPEHLPPRLERLLRRCLEKRVSERLRDIGEARILLRELLAEPQSEGETRPTSTAARTTARQSVVWALAAALVASAVTFFFTTRTSSRPHDFRPASTSFEVGSGDGGPIERLVDVLITPDGRHLVYTTDSDLGDRLFVRDLASFDGETRELEAARGAKFPFLSADGEWVAYFLGVGGARTIHKTRLSDGTTLAITREPHGGYRGSWAEDGTIVIGAQREALWRVLPGSDTPEPLTELGALGGDIAHVHPEVLPGGRGVVFTALGLDAGSQTIAVWDGETDTVKRLLSGGGEARFLPARAARSSGEASSGYLVFVQDGSLKAAELDLEHLEVVGAATSVLSGVRNGSLSQGATFTLSDAGDLAYIPGEVESQAAFRLVWMRPDGTLDEVVSVGDYRRPSISPDGQRFVAQLGNASLQVFELGSTLPVRELVNLPSLGAASWLPGSREIVYPTGRTSAARELLRVRVDGLGEPTLVGLPNSIGENGATTDGRDLLFDRDWNILAAPLDEPSEVRTLIATESIEGSPRMSPDGRVLAYLSNRNGGWTLYVTPYPALDRHVPVTSSSGVPRFAWGPDGRLFYSASGPLLTATLGFEPELRVVKTQELAWADRISMGRGFDVAPDGRFLVVDAGESSAADPASSGSARIRVTLGWWPSARENLGGD